MLSLLILFVQYGLLLAAVVPYDPEGIKSVPHIGPESDKTPFNPYGMPFGRTLNPYRLSNNCGNLPASQGFVYGIYGCYCGQVFELIDVPAQDEADTCCKEHLACWNMIVHRSACKEKVSPNQRTNYTAMIEMLRWNDFGFECDSMQPDSCCCLDERGTCDRLICECDRTLMLCLEKAHKPGNKDKDCVLRNRKAIDLQFPPAPVAGAGSPAALPGEDPYWPRIDAGKKPQPVVP